jgi:hypothetical protein
VLQSRGQALLQERLLQVIIHIFWSPGSAGTTPSGIPTDVFGSPGSTGTTSSDNHTDIWIPWFCRNDFFK